MKYCLPSHERKCPWYGIHAQSGTGTLRVASGVAVGLDGGGDSCLTVSVYACTGRCSISAAAAQDGYGTLCGT